MHILNYSNLYKNIGNGVIFIICIKQRFTKKYGKINKRNIILVNFIIIIDGKIVLKIDVLCHNNCHPCCNTSSKDLDEQNISTLKYE